MPLATLLTLIGGEVLAPLSTHRPVMLDPEGGGSMRLMLCQIPNDKRESPHDSRRRSLAQRRRCSSGGLQ